MSETKFPFYEPDGGKWRQVKCVVMFGHQSILPWNLFRHLSQYMI